MTYNNINNRPASTTYSGFCKIGQIWQMPFVQVDEQSEEPLQFSCVLPTLSLIHI